MLLFLTETQAGPGSEVPNAPKLWEQPVGLWEQDVQVGGKNLLIFDENVTFAYIEMLF